MGFIKTDMEGFLIYEPKVFSDDRGYFFESYNEKTFLEAGLSFDLVQDNQSFSSYGVLRGLHFQKEPHAQTKIIRVLKGKILDVVVDIRKNSSTYKKWVSVELSDDNYRQLIVPKGFAHGFVVLSDTALVMYKCDDFYAPKSDAGIRFDDPELNIDWKIDKAHIKVSDKDENLPLLKDIN
jgi:dTDP-4-dehydrorhamnose 3,5-epimerase